MGKESCSSNNDEVFAVIISEDTLDHPFCLQGYQLYRGESGGLGPGRGSEAPTSCRHNGGISLRGSDRQTELGNRDAGLVENVENGGNDRRGELYGVSRSGSSKKE